MTLILLQALSQGSALVGAFLASSGDARTRGVGFYIFSLGQIPTAYLLYMTGLHLTLAVLPVWLAINIRGILNNKEKSE